MKLNHYSFQDPFQYHTYPDTQIIIFAREPVLGKVKTRLIPALGREGATRLYQRLLDYTITQHSKRNLAPVHLCITPESRIDFFIQAFSVNRDDISVQQGEDLGHRMYHSMQIALKSYAKVLLIGTDCPFLTESELQSAIISLDNNDMVFSPANDGGYVLVGAKNLSRSVFEHIDWGTEKVMQQSRKALLNDGCSWCELAEQNDIDIPQDLKFLADDWFN